MPSCYLTIDDSPSPYTDEMTDYLVERGIPAMLFCRGDLLENNPGPIVRAIEKGFVIGNHSYSHRRFGELSYKDCITEIEKADNLIDEAYRAAKINRHGHYFRFPYLDRGDCDPIERHFEIISDFDINQDEKVQNIQSYLKSKGYKQPFQTNHPIYDNPSIRDAADCLMTFTSFDWMLTTRHLGKWDYQSVEHLKKRIDNDLPLNTCDGNILIFHDQDETFATFKSLIDHMTLKGYDFLEI